MNFRPVIPPQGAAAYSALIIALVAFGVAIAALALALVVLIGGGEPSGITRPVPVVSGQVH